MNAFDDLPVRFEPMTVQDIDAVMEIERVSFSAPWSARAYEHELRYNDLAHYFVARVEMNPRANGARGGRMRDWLRRIWRRAWPQSTSVIVGYVGYWLMAGEAHISTIAVHPNFRRRSYGEFLVAMVLEDAKRRGAQVATLEVRVSNSAAQQLYLKYGFDKVGLRTKYYSDNNEDAIIMTTPPLYSSAYQQKLQRLRTALWMRLRQAQPLAAEGASR